MKEEASTTGAAAVIAAAAPTTDAPIAATASERLSPLLALAHLYIQIVALRLAIIATTSIATATYALATATYAAATSTATTKSFHRLRAAASAHSATARSATMRSAIRRTLHCSPILQRARSAAGIVHHRFRSSHGSHGLNILQPKPQLGTPMRRRGQHIMASRSRSLPHEPSSELHPSIASTSVDPCMHTCMNVREHSCPATTGRGRLWMPTCRCSAPG